MMMSLILLLLKLQSLLQLTDAYPFAKPGCRDQCGGIEIPYPFGIGANCYKNESYEIICNGSFHPAKPFLQSFNLEVMNISWKGRYGQENDYDDLGAATDAQTILVGNLHNNVCTSHVGDVNTPVARSIDLRGSPYRFSRQYNSFVVEGCGASVLLKNSSGGIVAGCASVCTRISSKKNMTNCYGVGCCEASLSSGGSDYGLDFYEIYIHGGASFSSQTCNMAASLLDRQSTVQFPGKLSSLEMFPVTLEWRVAYAAKTFSTSSADNVTCDDSTGVQMCQCVSSYGYEGNPYIGCQATRECQKCKHGCEPGIYGRPYCKKHQFLSQASILGFSISTGFVILLLVCYWLYRLAKRIKKARMKASFFKKNGGLLLQQQISSADGVVDKSRIFSLCELEDATNNFSEDRILGQGGQGTVYKGMLVDGQIVAIKKSKELDKSQLEQFINEMVILSLVNHRSVVKLLGCCLETAVPLLVYEFISNGTLHQHIHEPSEDFHVTWIMRLQIAAESASALSYLHSSSSAPIYHRDIKSSNILLDENYRAKVSDFGTSRAITIEQTHVTTFVQGTYGYLDPEYFQSNQFTEKSDVYSFGVVLAELITGKKPIFPSTSGGWISLASEFLIQMETSYLFDILDSRVSEEAKEEELVVVANLAKRCLNMNGKLRPTMKEVAVLLGGIRSPQMCKPEESECLKSESMVMGYPYNPSLPGDTSLVDNSSRSSLSLEAQPLMNYGQ